MRKTIIEGREAVPVRMIPFIAGWGDFAPDGVAQILASGKDGYGFSVELAAYHLLTENDGTHKVEAMRPKEWDAVFAHLKVLTKKLKMEDQKERVKNLNYETWRKQSIEKLPSTAFVWLDDLKAAYDDVMKRTTFATYDGELGEAVPTERPGDKALNFSPWMTFEQIETAFEGFLSLPYEHEGIAELDLPNEFGYTIRGAAIAVSQKYGIAENEVRDSLFDAAEQNRITVRRPGNGFPYIPKHRRDFWEILSVDDLNKFFETEGVPYRLGDKLETAPPVVIEQQDGNKDKPRVMKKAALITKLEAEGFVNVDKAFRHSNVNGLREAAKAVKHGDWFVNATFEWFEKKYSRTSQPKGEPKIPLAGIEQLRVQTHNIKK